MVEIYIHNINQACLGYLLPLKPLPKFVIILGQGVLHTNQQLVSTIIKEQNAKMGQFRANETCATAAVIHELGHCFHQLFNPSRYYIVSQASMLRNKAQSELQNEYKDRHSLMYNASTEAMDQFVKAVNAIGAKVSTYAGTHPNEFIAECFAGQVMGLPYDQNTLQAYSEPGGPLVKGVVATGKGRPRGRAFMAPPKPVL